MARPLAAMSALLLAYAVAHATFYTLTGEWVYLILAGVGLVGSVITAHLARDEIRR